MVKGFAFFEYIQSFQSLLSCRLWIVKVVYLLSTSLQASVHQLLTLYLPPLKPKSRISFTTWPAVVPISNRPKNKTQKLPTPYTTRLVPRSDFRDTIQRRAIAKADLGTEGFKFLTPLLTTMALLSPAGFLGLVHVRSSPDHRLTLLSLAWSAQPRATTKQT